MNSNNKVLIFVLSVTSVYFGLSFFSKSIIKYYPSFKNVDLFADIQNDKIVNINKQDKKIKKNGLTNAIQKQDSTFTVFEDYTTTSITDFDTTTSNFVFSNLSNKLGELYKNKKTKIRIAWFGDSQIEGDLMTQDIREMLQNYFNKKKGVGFVPINSISADFRQTAHSKTSGIFQTFNFKQNPEKNVFLSGYSFLSSDLDITLQNKVKKDSTQILEKWLLFGKGNDISITQNGIQTNYPARENFNRVLLDKSTSNSIHFKAKFSNTPIYGVSFEPENGIVLDNFSFRGITGVELDKISIELLQKLNQENYYDLVVFQYGVNLMFRANDLNYDYYYQKMSPIIKKFKKEMPKTDFLIFSCSDRAFKYDNEWKTAIGIDSLIKVQARLSYDNKVPFYNLFNSMGGKGIMKKWVDTIPAMASKDYIHFNRRGSKIVAQTIFKSIQKEFDKVKDKKQKQNNKN
ncbi:hypothetical protein B0A78_11690 [Flavobacterium columnare NBRC 100251 = ATCC 23463]|uniref:hypothetical protein n=1 Tax=Flavobacterium columnare TaxID=996 RepID=UPI0007F9D717|nr:hypothetical protein [Flavobacterium columnare]ANO49031.1 hypothetical protein Pf1_00783 [Flavobacterium columnare]APT22962.1 hypothetical protein BU993_10250 [Flavobacterium columnare]MBF6653476.1 hypothetical protein [Flavobacterium columnare]MBF6656083.1 hypothetical protein [Flavobacterium columnare]MBF6658863.1 hypothetical protein [Flavobacterium columnare]